MGRRGLMIEFRYIHSFKDRHGKERYYFRRHGIRKPLPGAPGDAEFIEAYHHALATVGAEQPLAAKDAPFPEGSVGVLVKLYLAESLAHKRNSKRTQYVTKLILERFAAKHGTRLVRQIKRKHVEAIMAGMASTPAAANDLLKKIRRLMDFAITKEWITADPSAGVDPFKEGTHHTWTDEQIDAFEKKWPLGSKERTALALHIWTGQRSQDVRSMTWGDITPTGIRVVQGKTKAKLLIPVHPELRKALDAWPKTHAVILPTQFGKPFTEKGYGQWMAKAIERAGLPAECVAHGLRKATARRLAETGSTEKEIGAITGHKTLKEVARYTAAADQERLAETAIGKLGERTAKVIGKP